MSAKVLKFISLGGKENYTKKSPVKRLGKKTKGEIRR